MEDENKVESIPLETASATMTPKAGHSPDNTLDGALSVSTMDYVNGNNNMAMSNNDERKNRHKFGQSWIEFALNVYQLTLIFFTIVIAFWDIAIPIGMVKTFGSDKYSNKACITDRTHYDTPIWFNYQNFRQEFGVYWQVFVTMHVGAALLAFPTYFFQLCYTIPGTRDHKVCGIFLLSVVLILWTFGGIAAGIVVATRGFQPNAYKIDWDADIVSCPEYFRSVNNIYDGINTTQATSFSFSLYLQFAYDGALLNECLMHGLAAQMVISSSGQILKMWHIMCLGFITISSIFLYFARTISMAVLITQHDKWGKSGPLMMFLLMVAQFVLLPTTNIKNLRFTIDLYNHFGDSIQFFDKHRKYFQYHHGVSLTIAGFVVLWTFMANVFYSLQSEGGAAVAYLVVGIGSMLFWHVYVRECGICVKGCPGCQCKVAKNKIRKCWYCKCNECSCNECQCNQCKCNECKCCDKECQFKCCDKCGLDCITCYDENSDDPDYIPICCCKKAPKCTCDGFDWKWFMLSIFFFSWIITLCVLHLH